MHKQLLATKFAIGLFCALLVGTSLVSVFAKRVDAQKNPTVTSPPIVPLPPDPAPDPIPPDPDPTTTPDPNSPCGKDFVSDGALCLPPNPFGADNTTLVGQTTATGLIATIIRLLLYFAGIIAVLFLIIGGYFYLTARGNEEQATKGRQTLIYALLGLSIVILSYVIVSVITNQLTTKI